jgi:hypothetical protein
VMVLEPARPVRGTTEVLLRVGLAGFLMLAAIGFLIPAVAAAAGLRRGSAMPGARSTLLSSGGFALMSATLAAISILVPTSSTQGPSAVPSVLIVALVISVAVWVAGMLIRDPKA